MTGLKGASADVHFLRDRFLLGRQSRHITGWRLAQECLLNPVPKTHKATSEKLACVTHEALDSGLPLVAYEGDLGGVMAPLCRCGETPQTDRLTFFDELSEVQQLFVMGKPLHLHRTGKLSS